MEERGSPSHSLRWHIRRCKQQHLTILVAVHSYGVSRWIWTPFLGYERGDSVCWFWSIVLFTGRKWERSQTLYALCSVGKRRSGIDVSFSESTTTSGLHSSLERKPCYGLSKLTGKPFINRKWRSYLILRSQFKETIRWMMVTALRSTITRSTHFLPFQPSPIQNASKSCASNKTLLRFKWEFHSNSTSSSFISGYTAFMLNVCPVSCDMIRYG